MKPVGVGAMAGAVVVLGLLAGCAGPPGGTEVEPGGPVAYVEERSEGGDDATLDGTVTVADGCLTVVERLGPTWLPVVQKPRTTWDGTTLTYNGHRYREGSRIGLGGGGSDTAAEADYVPDGCATDFAFHVAP
jgi:hypothetical protein